MTFDKLAYTDFFSGLSLRVWTDSEFWQNLGSFADNIISLNLKGRRPEVKIVTFGQVFAKSMHPRSGALTINDFDPI